MPTTTLILTGDPLVIELALELDRATDSILDLRAQVEALEYEIARSHKLIAFARTYLDAVEIGAGQRQAPAPLEG